MSQAPLPSPLAPGPRRARLLRVVLWSFLLWTALGCFFAAELYFAGLPLRVALEWSLPRWYSWGLLTPLVFWIDRRLIDRLPVIALAALHVPLGIAWTSFAILLRLVTRPLRGAAFPESVSAFFLERFVPDLIIYVVIAFVSLLRAYTGRIRARERAARDHAANLERRLAEARLHGLRAQLQPHFLFNALNTISAFTETDPRLARRLMGQLGDLLRASLTHTSTPIVTLGEELTFLDDYLAIESARFEGRITVAVRADDDLVDAPVPSFLLQPLVENAIRHGVGPRLSGGHIDVNATRDQERMALCVRDNGVGLTPGWDVESHSGIGLGNLRLRLQQLYGDGDHLRVTALDTGGVEIRVTIPMAPLASWSLPAEPAGPRRL